MEGALLHYCEDGHAWTQQPYGGVSPSWGYGLTRIHYEQGDDVCPEPERGWSIYDDDFVADQSGCHHAYKCPSCGEKHYVGGCLMGVRCDPWNTKKPECAPPAPVCGKPPVRTLAWVTPMRKKGNTIIGWVPLAEYEANGQLILEVAA